MLLEEVLNNKTQKKDAIFSIIAKCCSQFLKESKELPLLKNLPSSYEDIQKVKIRWKRGENKYTNIFNEAFKNEHNGLRQRAVFANGVSSFIPSNTNDLEPFYIFPIDNYRFMYCGEVKNSSEEYKRTFDAIFEQFGNDKEEAVNVLTDLLKFTYSKQNLYEGILKGSEIILYNIPYYYAIRTTAVNSYKELFELWKN